MKGKKKLSSAMVIVLIFSMASLLGVKPSFATPGTYIHIEPSTVSYTGTSPGEHLNSQFTIRVELDNVTNCYGWDIQLTYNSSLLQYVGRTVVGTNQIAPAEVANYTLTDVSVAGTVIVGCAFSAVAGALPFNGTGVMEWITFKIIYTPPQEVAPPDYNTVSCTLGFNEGMTFLWDPMGGTITRDTCGTGLYEYKMTNLIPGAPTADFTYSPALPFVCDTVSLWDASDPGPSGAYITGYQWTITGAADSIGPLNQADTYFHCNASGTVTVTLNVTNNFNLSDTETKLIEQKEVIGCLLDLYTSPNRFCGQVTTVVGAGLQEPCDALSPDVNVTLFAQVTWNNAPVNHVLVAFEVVWVYYIDWADPILQDPQYWELKDECVLYRTAETDKDGIARIWFRVPTPCDQQMSGKWLATATAKIQEVKQNDTMPFDVGHLINLVSIETELPEYPRDCSEITFTILGKNIAMMDKHVTFIVTIYDDCDVPIGQVIYQTTIDGGQYCNPLHFQIVLYDAIHVPQWAYVGIGKAYVSAFTAIPSECGVPYCPEKSCIFEIIYIPPP